VEELRERLTSGSGTFAAFLGNNGVGKSTICNLLILNSSIDEIS
jgi:putative ribosome biogenesis GTPase RsgA